MSTLAGTVAVFLAAFAASSVLTALVWRTAPRLGFTDKPDTCRKIHNKPTALGGGLAVYVATMGALVAWSMVPGPSRPSLSGRWLDLVVLALAGAVIVTVGLVDDRIGLRGRYKLAGQIVASSIVIAGGLVIRQIEVFGCPIVLGPLSLPFTLFWLLGGINALNLMDGIDGLATILGIILVSTIGVMAMMVGSSHVALVALVFAGSLLGFLPFNFPPARVFLGDAGSMLIGLVVATLAIQGSLKGPGTVLLAAPLAVWTIPIFDSTAAILRRRLTGCSIYSTDRCHMHHRLMDRLGSNLRVLGWIAAACAATCVAAITSIYLDNDLFALVTVVAVVAVFIVANAFGRLEFLLLTGRLRKLGLSLLPQAIHEQAWDTDVSLPTRASGQWESLWATVKQGAEALDLSRVCVHIRFPAEYDGFDAVCQQRQDNDAQHGWEIEAPLYMDDQPVGRVTIAAQSNGEATSVDMRRGLQMLEQIQAHLSTRVPKPVPVMAPAATPGIPQATSHLDTATLARKHPK